MPSVLRVIGNSLAFLICLILAIWTFYTNPLLSVFFILATIDNYEDIYEIVTRKRLIPEYMIPVDIVFEIIMLLFGVYIFMLGFLYWSYFETPFAIFLLVTGVSILFSSTKDIVKDFQRLGLIKYGVSYGVPVHKIERFEFAKKK